MKPGTIIYGVLTASIIGFVIFAFIPEATVVEVTVVDEGPMTTWVQDDGFTQIREIYQINAPVSGRMLRLPNEPGDAVVAGESIIASIMPPQANFRDERSQREAVANVTAAEAALQASKDDIRSAEAEVIFAKSEIQRVEPLVSSGAISRARLDAAILQRDRAKARLDAANSAMRQREASLEVARAAVSGPSDPASPGAQSGIIHIKAPVSGQVLSLNHESEGVIQAGMPILEIGDPYDLEIIADFLSQKLVGVSPGTKAIIAGWGGDPFEARLKRVEPKGFTKFSALGVEEQRANIIVDFNREDVPVSAGATGLLHGYRVDIKLITWQTDNTLRIPVSALFRDTDGRWAVYRFEDNRAILVHPNIGHINDTWGEVVSGLSGDDQVIDWPSRDLQDGAKVSLD